MYKQWEKNRGGETQIVKKKLEIVKKKLEIVKNK